MKKFLMFLVAMAVALSFMVGAAGAGIAPEEEKEIRDVTNAYLPGLPVNFYEVQLYGTTRVVVGDTWNGIYLEFEAMLDYDGYAVREIWSRPGLRGRAEMVLDRVFEILNRPASEALGRNLLK